MRLECKYDEIMPLVDIKKRWHPSNENSHSEKQVRSLAKVMAKIGIRHAIHISKRSGKICGGHGRYLAAEQHAYESYPVIWENFEDELEEINYRSSDNIGQYAEFNYQEYVQNLTDSGYDVKSMDLEELGIIDFEAPSIEILPPQSDENAVPELKPQPVAKRGDVYLLGDHRLMCGDSTSVDDMEKLMDGERADIAFTSPPYNAGANNNGCDPNGQKYEAHNDSMSGDSYLQLLTDFTSNTLMYADMSIVNIQQLAGNKLEFIEYLNVFKQNFVDVMIWNKVYGTPSLPKRVMNCAFEYIIFFSKDENPPRTIKTAGDFHGCIQNVYNGPKQTQNEYSKIHRATFPLHLPQYIIENFSTGSVIDMFNGTGTSIIACQKLGRKCFAMEIDPLYVDVTIKRWEDYTGSKAELINGQ